MPRCRSCHQSRWVYIRFRRQAEAIEFLTGCVPIRCIACARRGWHLAHRVPPILVLLWRAVARLSPRPAWARFKVAAQTVRTRVRVDLRPIARILSAAAETLHTIAAASSRLFASARRPRVDGAARLGPLFAIPGGIAAAVVLGLWIGPALFSDSAPEANEMITSTAIATPEVVDAVAGVPAVGIPVPAPTPVRTDRRDTARRGVDGTRTQVARNDAARGVRTSARSARAPKPTPVRPPGIAPKAAPAIATALPKDPKFHGILSIRSEPLGALVWVDGELIGPTPVVLQKVAAGSVVVRIESGGYERWSSAARVVANKETSILASLQRASNQ